MAVTMAATMVEMMAGRLVESWVVETAAWKALSMVDPRAASKAGMTAEK